MATVRTYNPSVRVGNWNEDVCLEEDLLKDFLDKKEKGELLVQKTHNLMENILKKVELSVSADGFVHFGDVIMLVNPGQENIPASLQAIFTTPRPPTSLSVNMDEYKMHLANSIEAPCDLSASTLIHPCVRNSFVIKSVDGSENGTALRFGQPFALSTREGYGGNLNLFSDHARFNLSAKKSRQQIVQLVDEMNYLTTWQVLAFHPQQRLEFEGLPVPANTKLFIHHNKTGEKLLVHNKFAVRTAFGREYEVSAHTILDSHKAEMDNNHWVIVTGNPSDSDTTHFDRPLPQPSGMPKSEDSGKTNEETSKAETTNEPVDVDPKPATT